jgi:APA family basic amino acid/polyamine antiporter
MKEEGILGLKRVLGLKEVVAIGVGQTIGAGVFAMTGIAIGMCGAALPLAYAVAVIPVAILMLPLAVLGSAVPTVGGNYTYPSRLFSPMAAFMGVWIYAIGAFLGFFPLYALAMVEYLQAFFPAIDKTIGAVVILTFFYAVNILGIRLAAQIQGLMVLILIAALVMYDVVGLPHVELTNFRDFLPLGSLSVLTAAALLTFPYLGANAVIELGGEIKKPERTIPLSFVIVIPLVFVIYVTMSVVAVGVVNWETCAGKPLTESARAFLSGPALGFFIIGGALLAIATTLNATYMWGTKSLMIVGKDGLLPAFLTRVNSRFGTPHFMLTMIWLFSVAGVVSGIPINAFAIYASIGGLVIFIPVLISALLLPTRLPGKYKQSRFKVPAGILIVCVVLGIILFLGATGALFAELMKTSRFMTLFFFVWIVLGMLYYLYMKSYLAKRGRNLNDLKNEINI